MNAHQRRVRRRHLARLWVELEAYLDHGKLTDAQAEQFIVEGRTTLVLGGRPVVLQAVRKGS